MRLQSYMTESGDAAFLSFVINTIANEKVIDARIPECRHRLPVITKMATIVESRCVSLDAFDIKPPHHGQK